MKKLSKSQMEMLRFMEIVNTGKGAQTAKPGCPGNLIVHNALVRRGLVREDPDGTTHLTEEGKKQLADPKNRATTGG